MTDEPGPLLASGRAADVYDLGDGRVLRRYRIDGPDLDLEVRIMKLVRSHGYPVPEVFDAGGRDLVMEKVEGETMFDSLMRSPWKAVWHARLLAKLQRRLAAIEAPEWLLASTADPTHPESVLHLDLHPMNVMLSKRHGPIVIDWTNAAGGPAGFDAAMTFLEISTFEVDNPRDRAAQRAFGELFRRFRGSSLIAPFLVAACDHRLADPGTTPGERVAVAAVRKKAS